MWALHNVTKQLSLSIYQEDVLMLRGQTPAAMLVLVWLAPGTAAAAAPPSPRPPLQSRRVVWLSFTGEAARVWLRFPPRCVSGADTALEEARRCGAGRMTFVRSERRRKERRREEKRNVTPSAGTPGPDCPEGFWGMCWQRIMGIFLCVTFWGIKSQIRRRMVDSDVPRVLLA